MKKTPTLGIFELGLVPDELADRYPNYTQMIIDWLRPALPEFDYVPIAPLRGESIPAADTYDGYIYSGSKYGVYDDEPWITTMKRFVVDAVAEKRPQFGICFGHQLMADALGGRAVKSDRGWGCGIHRYDLSLNGVAPHASNESLNVLVMHQDQVTHLPTDATLLGGNDFCDLGAVAYQHPSLSVQFHPEFSNAYVADLLNLRGGISIDSSAAEAALNSLGQAPDNARIASWVADFFRIHFEQCRL